MVALLLLLTLSQAAPTPAQPAPAPVTQTAKSRPAAPSGGATTNALFFITDGFWEALPRLLLVAFLADVGLAVVGALLASIAVHTRARDLLLPLLLLPLTVPVVIGAASATKGLLSLPVDTSELGKWLAVLALYDLIFGLLAYAVFDFLMED
jgi:heme exporter protein B